MQKLSHLVKILPRKAAPFPRGSAERIRSYFNHRGNNHIQGRWYLSLRPGMEHGLPCIQSGNMQITGRPVALLSPRCQLRERKTRDEKLLCTPVERRGWAGPYRIRSFGDSGLSGLNRRDGQPFPSDQQDVFFRGGQCDHVISGRHFGNYGGLPRGCRGLADGLRFSFTQSQRRKDQMTGPRPQQRQRRIRNQDHRCPPISLGSQQERVENISFTGTELTEDLFEAARRAFFGTERKTLAPGSLGLPPRR
jgi:hypothetical protein